MDFLVQRARVPFFDPAHLGVEVALEGIIQVNDPAEMGPTQFCTQCVQNSSVRKHLSKASHIGQIALGEAVSEFSRQLSTQCVENLLPIFCPLLLQDVRTDAVADGPIEQHERGIHGAGDLFAGTEDELAQVGHQRRTRSDGGGGLFG